MSEINRTRVEVYAPQDFIPFNVELDQAPVSEHFAAWAKRSPERLALLGSDKSYSYGELNSRANQLANYLLQMLGEKEEPIGILFGRESAAIISILAILKAGKFYTGFDPASPIAFLRAICDDLEPRVILTNNSYLQIAEEVAGKNIQVVNVEQLADKLPTNNPDIKVPLDLLTAVYYTSGSTGKPKGVMVDHRATWYRNFATVTPRKISPSDRICLPFPIGFGWSAAVLFGALTTGASLFLYDYAGKSVVEVADWFVKNKITYAPMTSTFFRQFIFALPDDYGSDFPDMRLIFPGGEAIHHRELKLWQKRFSPGCIMSYGLASTEVGPITITYYTIDSSVPETNLTFGTLAPGVDILILDEQGQLMQSGATGEIVVRSKGVMKGYWKRDSLNKKIFMSDPEKIEKTLYLTGDHGRMDEENNLEFLGRDDSMVKIRGFRVQLGAIDLALRNLDGVKDAVTIIRQSPGKNEQLVAYLVMSGQEQFSVSQIRKSLSAQLPDYMIPSAFVQMDVFPRTATGKLARRELPELSNERPELETVYVVPQNKTEVQIALIWQNILGLERVGVDDNFFELGGDSLLAMQLLLEIEKEFSRKMPLAIISRASTIRQQAEILSNEKVLDAPSILIPIKTEGEREPIYCLAGAGGNAFRFHPLLKYLPKDRPVYFLRSRGLEADEWIETTVEGIASGYLLEIKRIQPTGPYHFIGSSGGGVAAYEMAQQLQRQGQDVPFLVMLDTMIPKSRAERLPAKGVSGRMHKYMQTLKKWRRRFRRQGQRIKQNGLKDYLQLITKFVKFRIVVVQRNFGKENIVRLQKKVEKANYAAGSAYKVAPYSGRVVYFRADRKTIRRGKSPDIRWEKAGVKELVIYPMDCGHFELLLEPYVQQVAERINQYLIGDILKGF